jgi:two-component system CheB/CheR fusion protein
VALWGHEARACFSGPEALAVAASFRPQVALLDLEMPATTGAALARQLSSGPAPRPWLVAVTATHPFRLSPADVETFDCRLRKPAEPEGLRDLLWAAEAAGAPGR